MWHDVCGYHGVREINESGENLLSLVYSELISCDEYNVQEGQCLSILGNILE